MPTKDDPRITVRLDRPLYDLLKAEADRRGVSVGRLARDRLATVELQNLPRAYLGCPVPGCKFAAPSPAAKCPAHGRTVR